MRILIVGASQGTGALAAAEALSRGHSVTAFARHPERLQIDDSRLTRVSGSFHDLAQVRTAVPGHDAVIVTASATKLSHFKENPNYFSLGTGHVLSAMKDHGMKRLVILSALGTAESSVLLGAVVGFVVTKLLLKIPFADHARQEQMVRESGLSWVIARPGRLTAGTADKRYEKRPAPAQVPSSISRADVAHFLIDAAENDSYHQQIIHLGG